MDCPKCGAPNDDNASRCVKCHDIVQQVPTPGYTRSAVQQPEPKKLGDDPVMRLILPVGRSGLAIAAGYLGLFSFIPIFGPIAIIFGVLAIRDIKAHPNKHGMGRAIFGIVAGALATLVTLVLLIIAAAK